MFLKRNPELRIRTVCDTTSQEWPSCASRRKETMRPESPHTWRTSLSSRRQERSSNPHTGINDKFNHSKYLQLSLVKGLNPRRQQAAISRYFASRAAIELDLENVRDIVAKGLPILVPYVCTKKNSGFSMLHGWGLCATQRRQSPSRCRRASRRIKR